MGTSNPKEKASPSLADQVPWDSAQRADKHLPKRPETGKGYGHALLLQCII